MFSSEHISYMIISGIISVALLFLMFQFCKTEKSKCIAIKFFALITVIIHYSSLWVYFLTTGSATVESTMLLPLYPCNICMWLLLITAFAKKRENFAYRSVSEFVFWAGCVCGIVGIVFNEQYAIHQSLSNYYVLKGLLSHSTMILGSALLAIFGIVRIRVKNVLSVALGLLLFLIDGAAMNALYAYFELPPCNSMYLIQAPFSDLPWIKTSVIGSIALVTTFVLSALYEQFFVPKNERWYRLMKRRKSANQAL